MKCPPIDWEDLYAVGFAENTVISGIGGVYHATPTPPAHLRRFLSVVTTPPDGCDRIEYLRVVRDALIACTDWTQAADAPLTQSQKTAWAAYRQALRDLPETYSGTGPISWPAVPS